MHSGFIGQFNDLRQQIETIFASRTGRMVILSGHSLGGTPAALGAATWTDVNDADVVAGCLRAIAMQAGLCSSMPRVDCTQSSAITESRTTPARSRGRSSEPYPAPYQRPFAHQGSRRRSSLATSAFASGCSHGVLIITVGEAIREAVAELLVSHKLSQQQRLKDFYRVDWPDFQRSP